MLLALAGQQTDVTKITGPQSCKLAEASRFKLLPEDKVVLTAIYRYHYYIQRALGNLIGLAQLLAFVAEEVGVEIGPLVCHSTYAVLDTEGGWSRAEMLKLIEECNDMTTSIAG